MQTKDLWLYSDNIHVIRQQARFGPGTGQIWAHSLLIPALQNHTGLSIFEELINFSSEVMAIKRFIPKGDN